MDPFGLPVGTFAKYVGQRGSCDRSLALQTVAYLNKSGQSDDLDIDPSLLLAAKLWEDAVESRIQGSGYAAVHTGEAEGQLVAARELWEGTTLASTWLHAVSKAVRPGGSKARLYAKEVQLGMSDVADSYSEDQHRGFSQQQSQSDNQHSPYRHADLPPVRVWGYADFLVLWWEGDTPVMRVVECKASPEPTVSHEVQVVCYQKLLCEAWEHWRRSHPHLHLPQLEVECVLAIKGQQHLVNVTPDLGATWPALPYSKVSSMRADLEALLRAGASLAISAALADAQHQQGSNAPSTSNSSGQGPPYSRRVGTDGTGTNNSPPDIESLAYTYGTHCGSCPVAGACLQRAAAAQGGQSDLQLAEVSQDMMTKLQRAGIRTLRALAGASEEELVAAGIDLVKGQQAHMQARVRLGATPIAASAVPPTPPQSESSQPQSAAPPAAGASPARQAPVELLPWAPPSTLPLHTSRYPLVQIFLFFTRDVAQDRLAACAARIQVVFPPNTTNAAVGCVAPESIRTLVITAGHQWSSVVSTPSGSPHGSHADDLAEGYMLDRFMARLRELISIYLQWCGPAQPHFYFSASHQASFLLTRLSHLVSLASVHGHTSKAGRMAQHLCWLQGLLGANPVFEGEQVLVSYLEPEAKTRFAWHYFGSDLYTLSQHSAGPVSPPGKSGALGQSGTAASSPAAQATGAHSTSSNSRGDAPWGGLDWGSAIEQLHQVESNETTTLVSRYREADVLRVAGCTALNGSSTAGPGTDPQQYHQQAAGTITSQQRLLLGTQGIAPSWFWAHYHLKQGSSSSQTGSAGIATWASLPASSQQDMQSKLELLSHNPGLLLHVLCKQVQAMAWVERLLQVTAAAFAHPTRGALAQLPSPQIKPVLLAAAAVPPSLAGGGGSTQGKDPLSLPDFQAMVRRAAEPVWSQTLDPAGTSSAAAAAAAVRVLSAARDAILLEHSTARASWQTDLTCRKSLKDRLLEPRGLLAQVVSRAAGGTLTVRLEGVHNVTPEAMWESWKENSSSTSDVRAAVLGSSLTPAMLAAPQSATTALDCWKVMFASVKAAQEIGPNDVTLTLGPPMGTRGSTRWCNDNRFLSDAVTFEQCSAAQPGAWLILEDAPSLDVQAAVINEVLKKLRSALDAVDRHPMSLPAPMLHLLLPPAAACPQGQAAALHHCNVPAAEAEYLQRVVATLRAPSLWSAGTLLRLQADQLAVLEASCTEQQPRLQLMQGPPGTGKTETLAAVILAHAAALAHAARGPRSVWGQPPGPTAPTTATATILVAAPTKQAIHTLLLRIQQRQHLYFGGSSALSLSEFAAMGAGAPDQVQRPPKECLELVCVDSGFDNNNGSGWTSSSGRVATSSASTSHAAPQQGTLLEAMSVNLRPSASSQLGGRLQQLSKQGIKVVINNRDKENLLSGNGKAVRIIGGTVTQLLKVIRDQRPYSVQLLVIDEGTQFPAAHMVSLVTALDSERGAILVAGDHRQLPSISKHDWDQEFRASLSSIPMHLSAYDYLRALAQGDPGRVTINSLSKSLRLPPPLIDLLAPTYALDHVQLTGLTAEEWVAANGHLLGPPVNLISGGSSSSAAGGVVAGRQGLHSSTAIGVNHLVPSFNAVASSSSRTSVRTPAAGGQRAFFSAAARATTAAGSGRVATAVRVDQQLEEEEEVEVLSRALGAVTLEQSQTTTATATATTRVFASHLERSYQAPAVPHPIDTQQPPLFSRAWEGLFGVFLIAHSECTSTKVNLLEQELVKQVLAAGGQGQVGPGSPGSCKRCVVLSPHNAQCWALRGAVKGQVDLVETVDKMQGDEALTIIYSATASDQGALTSNPDFYLSLNRANVAFSRAKARLIVIASQTLLKLVPSTAQHQEGAALWKRLRDSVGPLVLSTGMVNGVHVTVSGHLG